jgi:hypothetical protein
MQKNLMLLCLLLALPLFAESTLSGKIGDDMTIEESGNPYFVTDNVTVPPGKTLTIGEGVILLFKPFTGLIVDGSLVVEGSLEKLVIFSSENDAEYNPATKQLANPFDWNGILINQKAGLVKLSNFILEYSVYGVKSQKEEFIISNGTFTRNGQFHVTVKDTIKSVVDDIPFNLGKVPEEKTNSGRKPARATKATNSPNISGSHASWRKPMSIGLGAVGLAAIGLGGYFYYLSNNYASKYTAASTQEQANDYFDRKNSTLTTAGVCAIGGVVSAACAIAFYPWKPATAKAKKVTIAPILGIRNGITIALNH